LKSSKEVDNNLDKVTSLILEEGLLELDVNLLWNREKSIKCPLCTSKRILFVVGKNKYRCVSCRAEWQFLSKDPRKV